MKFEKYILLSVFSISAASGVYAQTTSNPPQPPPPASAMTSPQTKMSVMLAQNLEKSQQLEISRERREQAYAKLLEGQRYIWNSSRGRAGSVGGSRLAKQALLQALELNPKMAEGYTALAELAIIMPPNDIDDALALALIATKLDANNFGGYRIQARLNTFKSRLNNGTLDPVYTPKAIASWKDVTRLDARNAEAWAFLSEFYEKTNQPEERIEALKKWIASATPIETQFYLKVVGAQGNLQPESATLKLGDALLKTGKTREAIEIISRSVGDDPDNTEAVELLRDAIAAGDKDAAAIAIESLQQAVFANPENPSLIILLAETQARAGKFDDAAKVLQSASDKVAVSDKVSSANLQVALGDLLAKASRTDEAISAYQKSLTVRGLTDNEPPTEDEREFVISVFEKMIQTYKNANRPADVKAVIERARQLLGKNDLFADRQTISFYRESGLKNEALQTVRSLRAKNPADYETLRLEASILTENGKVEDAVALVKNLLKKKR